MSTSKFHDSNESNNDNSSIMDIDNNIEEDTELNSNNSIEIIGSNTKGKQPLYNRPYSRSIGSSSKNKTKDTTINYNDPQYKLEDDEATSIYIFKNKLFTRTLLPIEEDKERTMLVSCTSCKYKKVEPIRRFQASNF
jgi:hypothetical protein